MFPFKPCERGARGQDAMHVAVPAGVQPSKEAQKQSARYAMQGELHDTGRGADLCMELHEACSQKCRKSLPGTEVARRRKVPASALTQRVPVSSCVKRAGQVYIAREVALHL